MDHSPGALILVVDDHPRMARALAEMVERAGFRPTLASGGQAAVAAFAAAEAAGTPFRAVISDFSMADLDGLAVAAAVKRASPSTPVVVLTAYDVGGHDRLPANVDAILTKLPTVDVLRETLLRLMENDSRRH